MKPLARLLPLLLALLGLLPPRSAHALEVLVLDLDAFGLSKADAALASDGLREAMQDDGRVRPLTAAELADRVTAGHQEELDEARALVKRARSTLGAGDFDRGLGLLNEAEALHLAAGSELARPTELADLYTLMGMALVDLGAVEGAVEPFLRAEQLHPGYLYDRAPPLSPEARGAFEQARAERLGGPRYTRSIQDLDDIARAVGVDAVVSGFVEQEGRVALRLVMDGRLAGEVDRQLSRPPRGPGDPVHAELVEALLVEVAPARGRPERRPKEDPAPRAPPPSDDLDDLDALVTARAEGRSRAEPDRIDGGRERPPRAREGGRARWLLAAGGAALAGGVTAAVVVVNRGLPGDAPAALPPRYTVTLENPASSAD